jgi:hypothetical protein
MPESAVTWQSYEQVAQYLLNQFAEHFGLGHVEGKQIIPGASGTDWEIDAKAVRADGQGLLVVECRRLTTSRLKQENLAAMAWRITDTGAAGGIVVSPLDLQAGAQKVAAHADIIHVKLDPASTTTDYILRHLNDLFVGVSTTLGLRDSVSVVKITPPPEPPLVPETG